MKRNFAITFVLACCFLLTSCSRSSEFLVINMSDSVVEVEYTLNRNLKVLDNPTTIPLKMNFFDWDIFLGEFRRKDWVEIPVNEFIYDSETQMCKLKLAPNEVLRLTFVDYDDFKATEEFQRFEVVKLKISGKYGEVVYSGNQLYNQFEKIDSQNYSITYQQIRANHK